MDDQSKVNTPIKVSTTRCLTRMYSQGQPLVSAKAMNPVEILMVLAVIMRNSKGQNEELEVSER